MRQKRYRRVKEKMGKHPATCRTHFSSEVEKRREWMSSLASWAGSAGVLGFVLAMAGLWQVSLYLHMIAYVLATIWYGLRLTILPEILTVKPTSRNKKGIWGIRSDTLLILAITPGGLQVLNGADRMERQLPLFLLCAGIGAACFILCGIAGGGRKGWAGEGATAGFLAPFVAILALTVLNFLLPYTYSDATAIAVDKSVSSSRGGSRYRVSCQMREENWRINVSKSRYQAIQIGDQVVVREYTGKIWMKWQSLRLEESATARE